MTFMLMLMWSLWLASLITSLLLSSAASSAAALVGTKLNLHLTTLSFHVRAHEMPMPDVELGVNGAAVARATSSPTSNHSTSPPLSAPQFWLLRAKPERTLCERVPSWCFERAPTEQRVWATYKQPTTRELVRAGAVFIKQAPPSAFVSCTDKSFSPRPTKFEQRQWRQRVARLWLATCRLLFVLWLGRGADSPESALDFPINFVAFALCVQSVYSLQLFDWSAKAKRACSCSCSGVCLCLCLFVCV
jgi:hypothetical protein